MCTQIIPMRDAISSYFFSNTKQNSNSPQNWDSAFHYLYNSNDNLFMSIPNIKIEAPIDEPIFNNNTPLEQKNDYFSDKQMDHPSTASTHSCILSPRHSSTESTCVGSIEHSPLKQTPFIFKTSTPPPSPQLQSKSEFCLSNLTIKRMIGTGHFAHVYLAELDKRLYAIKAIDKKRLVSEQQINHVHNEKHILESVSHPFLVKLWGTFQTNNYIFLAMDYVPGGELFSLIQKKKRLSEEEAKFYAAEIVLAIEYLHSMNITYRDLKPENIILDDRGHIKLIDFGFAKVVKEIAFTLCGTPDYLAPEIIRARGYTKAVDWWSLGVLIYEMIVGCAPFAAETPIELYENILLCDVNWLYDMSKEAKDLIQGLLQTKPSERYTLEDIKNHPWFSSIDFDQLLKLNIDPPFVPEKADMSPICNQDINHHFHQEYEVYDDRFASF
ncbi:hypothetical protein RO3G_08604 [Rhizopus delemar RA 99-880]|uniref:cAMP-dependent protein kinase n=3 Tax=Rhizopus TaxID=4842 RepID=I1C619_RHIO9|nr:hypothetical protein RO3G_08604 [Rhizopus delemar RA 99-880]|eukprot:EIE83899.1 hypothetical protein RO3G_08604 [Rhizopus delemar RA 99-880]